MSAPDTREENGSRTKLTHVEAVGEVIKDKPAGTIVTMDEILIGLENRGYTRPPSAMQISWIMRANYGDFAGTNLFRIRKREEST